MCNKRNQKINPTQERLIKQALEVETEGVEEE